MSDGRDVRRGDPASNRTVFLDGHRGKFSHLRQPPQLVQLSKGRVRSQRGLRFLSLVDFHFERAVGLRGRPSSPSLPSARLHLPSSRCQESGRFELVLDGRDDQFAARFQPFLLQLNIVCFARAAELRQRNLLPGGNDFLHICVLFRLEGGIQGEKSLQVCEEDGKQSGSPSPAWGMSSLALVGAPREAH